MDWEDTSSSSSRSSTDMAYGDESNLSENEEMDEAEEDEDSDWYFAVVIGRTRGIFTRFIDVMRSTKGYSNATFRKLPTEEEAQDFLKEYGLLVENDYKLEDGSRMWFAYAMNSGRGDFPDSLHPSSLTAFCSGSAFTNGEPDCDAAYACVFPHKRDWDVVKTLDDGETRRGRPVTERTLVRANEEDAGKTKVLFIYTASRLLINSMSKWVYRWRNNGWRRVDGEEVQNRDILEKMMEAQGNRRVQWWKVKAHSGRRTWEVFWYEIAHCEAHDAAENIAED